MSLLQAPAAARPPTATATAWAHVFSFPRSRAAMTMPRSIAARRSPETRNSRATIAATIHAGRDALCDQHHERRHHEHLVGDRVEQRAEGRRLVPAAGEPAVDLIGRHRDDEDGRRPVVVIGEIPGEQDDDDGNRQSPCERQLIGDGHRWGRIRGEHGALHQSARREPRRDRRQDLPDAPRARHRSRRGVLRRRPRAHAYARGGRGVSDRARPRRRELSARRT